jgi:hypothetical protein
MRAFVMRQIAASPRRWATGIALPLCFATMVVTCGRAQGETAATVSDTLALPAGQYVGVSFPVLPSSPTLASTLSGLGATDPTRWRASRWSPTLAGYAHQDDGLGELGTGLGYWVIARDAQRLLVAGDTVSADTVHLSVGRALHASGGWNQLGNPFRDTLGISDVLVDQGTSLVSLDSPSNTLTDRSVLVWSDAARAYQEAARVPPHTAFWVRAAGGDTATTWRRSTLDTAATLDQGSIAVDPWMRTHVAYTTARGRYTGAVEYAVDLDGTWYRERVDETYDNFDTRITPSPRLAVDSKGRIALAYMSGFRARPSWCQVIFAVRRGGTWVREVVEEIPNPGPAGLALAFDRADVPHLCYCVIDEDSHIDWPRLKHATRVGSEWVRDVVDSTGTAGLWPAMTVDRQGRPLVLYRARPDYRLKVATRSAGVWDTSLIAAPGLGASPLSADIVVDSKDSVHVIYHAPDRVNFSILRYARRLGDAWVHETADGGQGCGWGASMVIDGADRLHASYWDEQLLGIRYISRAPGGLWSATQEAEYHSSGGIYVTPFDVAVDPNAQPRILYQSTTGSLTPTQLRLATPGPARVRVELPRRRASMATAESILPDPATAWAARIAVRQDGRESAPLLVGESRDAVDGASRVRAIPPLPPGQHPGVWSAAAEAGAGLRMRDLHALGEPAGWDLVVDGGDAMREFVLGVQLTGELGDRALMISDPRDGWVRPFSPTEPLALVSDGVPRRLHLAVAGPGAGPGSAGTIRAGLLRAYPNPTRGSLALVLGVRDGETATVEILDVAGRRTRTLERRATAEGEVSMVWDGRDDAGLPVRPGVYLARYTAGAILGVKRLVVLGAP